jgi:His-Xaa-Ser system protein HxsD
VTDVTINAGHTAAELNVDRSVYSKAAILRTCYWLEKELVCHISEAQGKWLVNLSLRYPLATLEKPKVQPIDYWISEFQSALIDSQLRIEIQTETASIRELILAKAFAKSGILEDEPPGTFADPVSSDKTNSLISISTRSDIGRNDK